MELQILRAKLLLATLFCFALMACEREISINLPPSQPELVVEACINTRFPTMNYVFISQTVDYFNPNLSLLGIYGAEVYITEGEIMGQDTVFDVNKRQTFINGGFDSLGFMPGLYVNPSFMAKAEKPYKLEIFYQGKAVTGVTYVPASVPILQTSIKMEGEDDGVPQGYLSFKFFDPPGPSYYRIALTFNKDSSLLGFGDAFQLRRIDDSNIDNQVREYSFTRSYSMGDTLNVYLCRLGFREFKFWESFGAAENNDGPFATPVKLKSTLQGAIGSFTGYNIDHKTQYVR
jgi:hypothetical protein